MILVVIIPRSIWEDMGACTVVVKALPSTEVVAVAVVVERSPSKKDTDGNPDVEATTSKDDDDDDNEALC